MYVVTNRAISNKKNLAAFGKTLNPRGPNELRLLQVTKRGRSWAVKEVPDQLDSKTVKALDRRFKLGIDVRSSWYGSLLVACELLSEALREKKSILFYVHGFNNDVSDVLETSFQIENLYKSNFLQRP